MTRHHRNRAPSIQWHLLHLREIIQDVACLMLPGQGHDRRYQAILDVSATNYALKSEEEQAVITASYRALLRSLTFPIQIVLRAQRMDLSSYIRDLDELRDDPIWGTLARTHQREMQELGARRTLIDRHFYLIIPASSDLHVPWFATLPLIGRRARARRQHEGLAHAQQILTSRTNALCEQLTSMGLTCHRLSGHGLAQVYYQSVRGEEALLHPLAPELLEAVERPHRGRLRVSEPPKQEAPRPDLAAPLTPIPPTLHALIDLLAPASVQITPRSVQVGEEYVRGIAVVGLPREVMDGWFLPFLRLDEIMDVVFHIVPHQNAAMLRRLMRHKAQYASTQRLNLKRGRQEDPALRVAESDVDTLIALLASGEEHMEEVGFYILARARDERSLETQTTRILTTLAGLLMSAHPTTFEHLETYLSCLPEGRNPLGRTFTINSTVLATMFPFVSDSLFLTNGTFAGVTPTGDVIVLDPWTLENPHEFWGGITGAGKSYAIKLRILHEALRGQRSHLQVIVIDPAQEYGPLADALGGKCIRLAPGAEHCINPFDLLPRGKTSEQETSGRLQSDRLADKIQKLHALLDMMLSDYIPEPTTLTSGEKAVLDRALYETYRRVGITADPRTHDRPAPLMRDLYEVLRSGTAPIGTVERGLIDRLERFVQGSMAGLFNHPTNVDLESHMLVFDIHEMSGSSELRAVGMFLITDFLWTQALHRPRPRRCYIDEAWSLIEHAEGGRFLERMAREARKQYLSLITITQNPEKFVENRYGSIIAQNAMTKVLKRLDTVGSKAAREAFGLTQEEERRLVTLEQSRALLIIGTKRMIVEIAASEEEHALITTHPREWLAQQEHHESSEAAEEIHT